MVIGGHIGDRLLVHHTISGRILVRVVGYTVAAVAFVPAFLTHSLLVALPLFVVTGAGLSDPNPPWTRPAWTSSSPSCRAGPPG